MIRTPRRHLAQPEEKSRSRRLVPVIGVAGAVFFLVFAGVFMAIPLLGTRSPPTALTYQIGDWRVDARVDVAAGGAYEVVLRFYDPSGKPGTPAALAMDLSMLGHPMPPLPVALAPIGAGTYRAQGTLEMAGKWRFQVQAERRQFEIVVNHAEEF